MAVRFNATGQRYKGTLSLGAQTVYTACLWVKIAVDQNNYQACLSLDNDVSSNAVFFETQADGTTWYTHWDNSQPAPDMVNATVGTWYFLAMSVNGSNVNTYMRLATSTSLTSFSATPSNTATDINFIHIGDWADDNEWLNGSVTGVKLWTGAALTADELMRESQFLLPVRTTNLSAAYPLLNPETADYSGNGKTLTGGTGATRDDGPPVLWAPRRRVHQRFAPTSITVDVDAIDISLSIPAVDPLKDTEISTVPDVTVIPQSVTTAIQVDVDPIDITLEHNQTIASTFQIVDYVDVTVQLPALDLEKIIDLDLITIETVSQTTSIGKTFDLGDPIEITVENAEVSTSGSQTVNYIDTTVEVLPVDVEKETDLGIIDVTTQVTDVDAYIQVDLDPIDITITPVEPITYRSKRLGIIDITTQVTAVDPAHIADPDAINITTQFFAIDPAHIVDLPNTIPITTELRPLSFLAFDDTPIDINIELPPISWGFSVESFSAFRGEQEPPIIQPTRIIAQNILTKEFLHWELPVSDIEVTYTLSGPQVITGVFSNEILDLADLNLEPWGVWIHVEEDGVIRASGILQPTSLDENETLSLEAVGVSAYPAGMPYMAEYTKIQIDPAQVVRDIWAHLQSHSDAKLGVVVTGSTTVKIGKPLPPPIPEGGTDTNPNDNDDKPYTLMWWEAPDCGQEINQLAQETPFDYVERQQWNADKTDVLHFIDIGFPRIGRMRDDLSFVQEENLVKAIGPEEVDDMYASQVVFMGKGEGRDIIRGYAGKPYGKRIRRVAIIDDPTVDNVTRANALANREITRRQALQDVTEVEIDAYHPNARLGSFSVGDDIPLRATVPWIGDIYQWERILSYTYSPQTETIRVSLRRSESFTYGSGG